MRYGPACLCSRSLARPSRAGWPPVFFLQSVFLNLTVETEAQFERLAIELATDPDRLAAVTSKLAQNRIAAPLFDTLSYVRHLERAFVMMMGRRQDGLEPDHIQVTR
jgi:hypothetical protein